jgi:hypothetical protein
MLLSGEGPIKDRLRPRLGMFHGRLHYLHRLGVMDLFEKGKWDSAAVRVAWRPSAYLEFISPLNRTQLPDDHEEEVEGPPQ